MKFDPEVSERRLRRNSWLAVLLTSLVALAWGWREALAVAGGGGLAALNVEGLAKLTRMATAREPSRGSLLAIVGVGFRYLLLGVGLFVIVGVWHANVIAVSLGLSAPVMAVFLEWGLDTMREFRSK